MDTFSIRNGRAARAWAFVALLLLATATMSGVGPMPRTATAQGPKDRPNVLIIMTDDQSHDTLTDQFMPNTKAMIANEGITFTGGFMSTPLCCPSRSSFLTGKYARNHGVHVNSDKLTQPTLANHLQDAGYYTGLIGKYLNSWPGDARPEYDYWACWKGGDFDPRMNVFGENKTVPGYTTYILRDFALDFLKKVPQGDPFFLLFATHAPHGPAIPAPGDEKLYSDLDPWRPPNFNPAALPGKPKWLQETPPLTDKEIADDDEFRLDQLRCLHSVDVAIKDILDMLREQNKLDNTLIVFYSDNGYFWGEQRLLHKNRAYEEASHGPFALRYKPLVEKPRVEDRLIQVIDLAPTIYELTGVKPPADIDGKSLVPLMQGTTTWRDALLLEGWPGKNEDEHYRALRTERYVYIETDNDTPELYDLNRDPFQMNNILNDPSRPDAAKIAKKLGKRLNKGDF